MHFLKYVTLIPWYIKRQGLTGFLKAGWDRIWHNVNNNDYLYVYDLQNNVIPNITSEQDLSVQSFIDFDSIPPGILEQLIQNKAKDIVIPFLKRFFKKGAILWVALKQNTVLGLQWTQTGAKKRFHSIPLLDNDAIILASEVFVQYRGRNIWPSLMRQTLLQLLDSGIRRVYIMTNVNNKSMQRSIRKTGAKLLGAVRTISLFGNYVSVWNKKSVVIHNV